MREETIRDIHENITQDMTDEEIIKFVDNYTCRECGEEFNKPRSCEECINYEIMRTHKDHLYNLAIETRNIYKIINN
ncbi:MAG: hypothetical protein WC584_02470 [Candidatus Pacearchaeota archaeon]